MATILIVDDRPTNRELLVTLLGYAGHRVLEAADGEMGLAIARAEHLDLIITDIVMPTMDGYEFARQVRADPAIRETQIIFHTSSYIVAETRRLAEACGVHTVLAKPIEPEILLETVKSTLESTQKPVIPAPASDDFHREHMRLLTDSLAKKVEQLEAEIGERKRVEGALQASEELFRSAFQHSPVGMCITGVDGIFQTVNQSLVDMLGFSEDELKGKHFNDITYAEDLEIGRDVVSRMVSGEVQSVAFEKRYLHKSGESVWSHVSATLLRESSGKPIHFVTQILDISERKRAEAQVRAHTARLKVLADASQTFAMAVQDYQEMLEIVARQTAEVMDGSCGVRLLSEDGEWLELVALYDVDARALEITRMLSSQPMRADEPNFVQRIMQSDRAILMPGISDDQLRAVVKPEDWDHLPYIASHSRLLAPIRTRSESLGILIISRRAGSVAFDEHDLRLVQDLADRAALAISNARFFRQLQNELAEHQRTESARLESEARYHRVLDAMMEGCQIIDFDWRYVYVNDLVVAQGKQTREELLSHTMMEVYPGIENTELFAVLRECMEQRVPRRMENQFTFPDGSLGWFELSVQPAREGIFILSTDITERKRAEERLRQSEENFSKAFSSSPTALMITRREDGMYLELNKAYTNTVGYERGELIGHLTTEFNIFINPDQRKQILTQLVANGALHNYEAQIQNKSGELRTVLASLEQIQFNEEDCILTTLVDITERKRAEERNRFLANLVANVSDAIIAVDMQQTIQSWNNGAESLYGWKEHEVLGQPSKDILDTDFIGMPRAAVTKQIMEQGSWSGEALQLHRDGTRLPVQSSVKLYKDTEGRPAGIVAVNRDITERKRAEQTLQTKNEELKAMSQQLWQAAKLATMGELAASIAHELNNPLATVSLRAEMLQAQFGPDDPQSKSLQIIDSEVKRMSGLVMNLLQFSRRSASQTSTINVNDEVANSLELVQYHLRKNGVRTVQELSPEIPLVQADRQQLRQVFLNLFTNAVDAMPLGGMLTIRSWTGEKPDAGITAPLRPSTNQSLGLPTPDVPQVFIEVSDTGEGIKTDNLERVWEPFFTTKPEGKGTGLGLAICRRIIQEHGGTIKVLSDGIPGKGTTIQLTLPAQKER